MARYIKKRIAEIRNYRTLDDLMRKILRILPDAVFDEDNNGQIIIYTGLRQDDDFILLNFGENRKRLIEQKEDIIISALEELQQWYIEQASECAKSEEYQDLEEVYLADGDSISKLTDYIKNKDLQKAYSYAKSLDTIVRDSIPDKVWSYLEYMTTNEE